MGSPPLSYISISLLRIKIGCEVDLFGLKPNCSSRVLGSTYSWSLNLSIEAYNLYIVCVNEIGLKETVLRGSFADGLGIIATLE